MDNQHRLIKSYRDLNQEEIDLINKIKAHERETLKLLKEVEDHLAKQTLTHQKDNDLRIRMNACQPYRWIAIARHDIEIGFMAAVRAVAQPYNGPEAV
jgi:hypothetical protein